MAKIEDPKTGDTIEVTDEMIRSYHSNGCLWVIKGCALSLTAVFFALAFLIVAYAVHILDMN